MIVFLNTLSFDSCSDVLTTKTELCCNLSTTNIDLYIPERNPDTRLECAVFPVPDANPDGKF